ncbi:MAG: hypothetical protein ABI824_02380 [Acidobacteriota bacterium]
MSSNALRELSAIKATLVRAIESPPSQTSSIVQQAIRKIELLGSRLANTSVERPIREGDSAINPGWSQVSSQ